MRYSTILHIKKYKKWDTIKNMHHHNFRLTEVNNANPEMAKNNEIILGTPSFQEFKSFCTERLAQPGDNCTQIVQMTLSATKEFFVCYEDELAKKVYDMRVIKSFVEASHNWLTNRFGDKLVSLCLHMDEACPHLHAMIQPITEEGKLNLEVIFPGRGAYSELQTSFANALSHLGILRPYKGKINQMGDLSHDFYPLVEAYDNLAPPSDFSHLTTDLSQKIKEQKFSSFKAFRKFCSAEVEWLLNSRFSELNASHDALINTSKNLQIGIDGLKSLGNDKAEALEKDIKLALQVRQINIFRLMCAITKTNPSKMGQNGQIYQILHLPKEALPPVDQKDMVVEGPLWPQGARGALIKEGNDLAPRPQLSPELYKPAAAKHIFKLKCGLKVEVIDNNWRIFGENCEVMEGRSPFFLINEIFGYPRENISQAVRLLAQFSHPNLVKAALLRHWAQNAYQEVRKLLAKPFGGPRPSPHCWEKVYKSLLEDYGFSKEYLKLNHKKNLIFSDGAGNAILCGKSLSEPLGPQKGHLIYFRVNLANPYSFMSFTPKHEPFYLPGKIGRVVLTHDPISALKLQKKVKGAHVLAIRKDTLASDISRIKPFLKKHLIDLTFLDSSEKTLLKELITKKRQKTPKAPKTDHKANSRRELPASLQRLK
ncbi:MAG: plasmid recombination protein [Deltaproteobacteria bacterium]|nr:plasmid recombination protein [Deltaproteobacteria bacterium]